MPQIAAEQLERLSAIIRHDASLERIVREIEGLHRIVFHDNPRADWSRVRQSAEQILIAELVNRYQGEIGGLLRALRDLEQGGTRWEAACRELARGMHSYYTTPLGIVMRQDLFGDQAVFITPDAYAWTARQRGQPTSEAGRQP